MNRSEDTAPKENRKAGDELASMLRAKLRSIDVDTPERRAARDELAAMLRGKLRLVTTKDHRIALHDELARLELGPRECARLYEYDARHPMWRESQRERNDSELESSWLREMSPARDRVGQSEAPVLSVLDAEQIREAVPPEHWKLAEWYIHLRSRLAEQAERVRPPVAASNAELDAYGNRIAELHENRPTVAKGAETSRAAEGRAAQSTPRPCGRPRRVCASRRACVAPKGAS